MKNNFVKVSFIIPCRPEEKVGSALAALAKLRYPPEFCETWLVSGRSPSLQRNLAAGRAKGEILYFLDSDSEIHPWSLKRVLAGFVEREVGGSAPHRTFSLLPPSLCLLIERKFFSGQEPAGEVAAVGGPNIWHREENFWSSITGVFFDSFFAYHTMTSRFRPTGRFRYTDERELILCNLAVKRKIFLEAGGFKEELYPNEENEFLGRLLKKGFSLIYHPGVFVERPRRESLIKILRMFYGYGRGRMEHIRVRGLKGSFLFLVPLALLCYFIVLVIFRSWWLLTPLVIYLSLGFGSALGFALRRKKAYLALILPWFFLLVHLTYAFGLLCGLVTDFEKVKKKKHRKPIKIFKVKEFGQRW